MQRSRDISSSRCPLTWYATRLPRPVLMKPLAKKKARAMSHGMGSPNALPPRGWVWRRRECESIRCDKHSKRHREEGDGGGGARGAQEKSKGQEGGERGRGAGSGAGAAYLKAAAKVRVLVSTEAPRPMSATAPRGRGCTHRHPPHRQGDAPEKTGRGSGRGEMQGDAGEETGRGPGRASGLGERGWRASAVAQIPFLSSPGQAHLRRLTHRGWVVVCILPRCIDRFYCPSTKRPT